MLQIGRNILLAYSLLSEREILEVGAGLGATTAILCDGSQDDWVCLEPDRQLLSQIGTKIHSGDLPSCCRTRVGRLQALEPEALFDDILCFIGQSDPFATKSSNVRKDPFLGQQTDPIIEETHPVYRF